jgi:acetolactate synthase I/II/III large subunit
MNGSELILKAFEEEGVDIIFGYPGGSLIPFFDALYDNKNIKCVLTRHEQGAVHAADGYARATGKVGVCIATSGPGATNLVTGIATANMDSIPLVAITGQVRTNLIGNDAFQEADVTGITRPISKHNYLVKDIKDLPVILKQAFHIATTGRPGPVVIDLPVDISMAETKEDYPKTVEMRSYNPKSDGHKLQIKKTIELIEKSKKPVIYAGGGVIISEACKELTEFANKTGIPVTTTLMGLGCFPEDNELSLGMLGMHGTFYANYAVTDCDLLISIGSRFDDRVTGKISEFAPHAKIIHIDIDPSSISKNVKVDLPIVGDAKKVLKSLIEIAVKGDYKDWHDQINQWKKEYPLSYDKKADEIKPQFVMEKINELTDGNAIIVTEVGQSQMWAAQFFTYVKPRTYISSGGLGTMGFGFPAAIGVQLGCPDKVVFDISGDGSFQMNLQELSTAVEQKLPIKIIILNNGCLGMVRQWQELFYGKRYSKTILNCNPDFVKLAEAYGAQGIKVEKPDEVEGALKKALAVKDGPIILDIKIPFEENVFPMVPAGAAINRMIGGMA